MKETKKVLVISHDKIGSAMAGPGIRYHYMAETLSGYFDVTVGFFDPSYLPEDDFSRIYDVKSIDAHYFESGFKDFEVVISHYLTEGMIDYCNARGIFIVFDLYVPGPVENLAGSVFGGKGVKHEDDFEYDRALNMYRRFFENGDLFLVSNRRQLDYWIGYVFGADQIHLSTYPKRPIYDRFIYVPMGIDSSAPLIHVKNVMKGVIPGIEEKDKVLLWTGGIWGHFDGQVLMRAMKRLQKNRPDIKLVFFGTQHPNPNIPEMKESLDTRELAKKLGLTNKTVFFQDGWVKYPERINYLLEADAAVNTHKASIETEFSHRTRVLDHLLAELPTISTKGDYFSDEVIKPNRAGAVVPANDEAALEKAILEVLEPDNYNTIKKNTRKIRKEFDWTETMKSLVEFLKNKPTKLQGLETAPKLTTHSRPARLVKKVLPVRVKKALIRTLRMK